MKILKIEWCSIFVLEKYNTIFIGNSGVLMALNGCTVLAVVPARGGSKSIPRKNLAKVCGISLVAHAGRVLSELDWIDAKILSTDNDEIATEGAKYGLETPFKRPDALASDTATSLDMWQHAWKTAEEVYNRRFDISLLIEPTSPLRLSKDIERTAHCVSFGKHSAAVTVSRTPAHYTPQKTLVLNSEGNITYFMGVEGRKFHNRQAIPVYYHRNGVCYAVSRKFLMEEGLIMDGAHPVVVDRPLVNIDEQIELDLASWLMERQGKEAS